MSQPTRISSFKRWNPILGEWVIIAQATGERPWSGAVVSSKPTEQAEHDPDCYLCPGVTRASGKTNPDYSDVFVFDNDFPSLSMENSNKLPDATQPAEEPARGICRVLCFSPKHNVTLAEMDETSVAIVLQAFKDQYIELSEKPGIQNVMMFENKGKIIGVSNPHPHGQIYATDFVPRIPSVQYNHAVMFMKRNNGKCLFCSLMDDEIKFKHRIVSRNTHFIAYIPGFARHTFEVHILPLRHVPTIAELTDDELQSLAAIYSEILVRYDNLFEMSFPNITIFRNCPCEVDLDRTPYHFHIEFCPPLRSSDKLKYMAGFETGGGNIVNPSLPRESAEALRSVSTTHYLQRTS